MKIYINGEYYDKADAQISVFDHGLLYGDGVFEGIRIYNGRVFKLKEHIERLYQSAKAILLEIPVSNGGMEEAVIGAVKINKKENGYIRLMVTRGEGLLGIDPTTCRRPTIIIIVSDIQAYPEKYYKNGIGIITASSRRIPSDCLDPRIKSLNYLNNIMAKIEARQANCLEAVMLNKEGFVTECTGDNIFIVKNDELLTPASYQGALDGITMSTVIDMANSLKIKTLKTSLTRYDIYNSDECFLTGTGAEIIPVIKIDGRVIGNGRTGAITRRLIKGFKELVMEF
ncbi:MAG: branched-chain-amino-acid transaminase [Nitrospirae bacterium]|nr:branched-chain-amino-acid transaminase [Nitrospirota bacterium]